MQLLPKTDAWIRTASLSQDAMSGERVDVVRSGEKGQRHVGHHRIIDKLGEGGMGVVYVAVDERLGRKVAIKLLRERSDAVARRRFFREARALAHLSHPNVVQIYDIDEYDDQIAIVMEYVEGRDVAAWISEAQRSHLEILEVFIAAGQGLMAAHARGIIHRDFKPANVMLGHDGRIRVVDFGVARGALLETTQDGNRESTQPHAAGHLVDDDLTQAGALIGTPAYMAPEQLRGGEANRATDQFSFCVALWEALYGNRPFEAVSKDGLLARMESGKFAEAANDVHVPGWLRAAVVRGLAMDPDDRWPSIDALIRALRRPPSRVFGWARQLGVAVTLVASGFVADMYLVEHGDAPVEQLAERPLQMSHSTETHELRQSSVPATPVLEKVAEAEPARVEPIQPEPQPFVAPPQVEADPPVRSKPFTKARRHQSEVAGDARTLESAIEQKSTVITLKRGCVSLLSCLRPKAAERAP